MTYYNGRDERERRERDTPERILMIARAKGEFFVSLRWRDDWLRQRCAKLRKQGLLRGGKKVIGGGLVYLPVPKEHVADRQATVEDPA